MELAALRIRRRTLSGSDLSFDSSALVRLCSRTRLISYHLRACHWAIHRHWQPLAGRKIIDRYGLALLDFASDTNPPVLQRLVVAVSCVMFYLLINPMALDHGVRLGMFVLLTALACVEKLCSIMNLVSVEKDWVSRLPHPRYATDKTQ